MLSKSENFMQVLLGEEPDWVPVECPANPDFGQNAYNFVTYEGALPPQSGGIDLWGTRWVGTGREEIPYIVEYPVASIHELSSFDFPNIDDEVIWEKAKNQVVSKHHTLAIGRQVSCLWERLYFLIGFDNALMALMDEPGLVTEALTRIADWQIQVGDHFADIGVDAVRISDDYGAQNNLLMAPNTWRKLIKPHLKRLVGHYKKIGIPIALHSCGNLRLIMDDLVELGFSTFNIQANVNDLEYYQKRYGKRFRLWGGISSQAVLASGSPEQIRQAVVDIINLFGINGCLILEPDQIVALPEKNLSVFWEAASELISITNYN